MKKILLFGMLFTFVLACAKYTTPKKVSRKIIDGSWKITALTSGGQSIIESFQEYSFSFTEDGTMLLKGSTPITAKGSWDLGLNKNPAILYLSFPPVGGLEYLSDDWQVTEMTSKKMALKSNDAGVLSNIMVFQKI